MSTDDEAYETPKWRTAWLLFGFLVLVGVGVVTVLRPELEDEPNEDAAAEIEARGEREAGEPLQE